MIPQLCSWRGVISKTLFIVAAGHGVELPFVFHTATLAGFNYSQSELELTNHMVLYWTNFAHHSNPNGPQDSPQVRNIILESVFSHNYHLTNY